MDELTAIGEGEILEFSTIRLSFQLEVVPEKRIGGTCDRGEVLLVRPAGK